MHSQKGYRLIAVGESTSEVYQEGMAAVEEKSKGVQLLQWAVQLSSIHLLVVRVLFDKCSVLYCVPLKGSRLNVYT